MAPTRKSTRAGRPGASSASPSPSVPSCSCSASGCSPKPPASCKQVQAMSEHQHIRADGTVTFLPHRLNRHPVVVRGLTADELWGCCGLSGAAGLLIGAPLSWVFRTIAIAPTFVVLGVALGIFVGGGILRRLNRGRRAGRRRPGDGRRLVERTARPDHPCTARPALRQHPQVVGSAARIGLCLHVLRVSDAQPLAHEWRRGLRAQPPHAFAVLHPVLPGLPAGRLRLPPQHGRAAPARARHLRDPRPRLCGDGGDQRRRVLRRRAGQARPGALPHQGDAGGRRSRAQPVRAGARLLLSHAAAHQRAGTGATGTRSGRPGTPSASRSFPMQHPIRPYLLALLGLLAVAASPVAQAVETLRWERMPLAVPLRVGQERIVFIDRNVRVGVPAGVRERLRVQSAGGAVYLRANEPIEPTRLQLQDADTGALILLDIAAEPAKDGEPALEPVRIVEGSTIPARYGDQPATADEDAPARGNDQAAVRASRRETPIPVVLTRFAAQNLYAPLRTVEPLPGVMRVNLRRDLDLGTLMPTLPVRAAALASWRLEDQWVTAVRLSHTGTGWITLDPRVLQ